MIRKLQWNDMEDLISNYFELYDEVKENPELGIILFREKPTFESEVKWFSNLYYETISGHAFVSVAEEDGRVVGICDVHRVRPGTELDHNGSLGILIVREFRGRGIGTSLINHVISQCRGELVNIRLDVYTVNANAISLYRKCGFTQCGSIIKAVKRAGGYLDEIVMCLSL